MKTKSVQDGVLFYLNESGDVVDIDVNAGIKSVVIDDDVSMLESNKSFPDVEQLVINDNVGKIRIWNKLFPNIKILTHTAAILHQENTLLNILMQ